MWVRLSRGPPSSLNLVLFFDTLLYIISYSTVNATNVSTSGQVNLTFTQCNCDVFRRCNTALFLCIHCEEVPELKAADYKCPCNVTSDCVSGEYCSNGFCNQVKGPQLGCYQSEECMHPLECINWACIEKGQIGHSCLNDDECSDDLRCQRGTCIKGANYGEDCVENSDCYRGLYCLSSQCRRKVTLGDRCLRTDECQLGDQNSICWPTKGSIDGRAVSVCRCHYGYKQNYNKCDKENYGKRSFFELVFNIGILCLAITYLCLFFCVFQKWCLKQFPIYPPEVNNNNNNSNNNSNNTNNNNSNNSNSNIENEPHSETSPTAPPFEHPPSYEEAIKQLESPMPGQVGHSVGLIPLYDLSLTEVPLNEDSQAGETQAEVENGGHTNPAFVADK